MKKKAITKLLLACMCLITFLTARPVQGDETSQYYVAIIIDDFGNQMAGTKEIANLPIHLTGAVIPGMPFANQDATLLHEAGKEVILHVPLQPINGKASWLGPKGITVGMSAEKVEERLKEALEEIPYAVGMNNHMGSLAMQNKVIVGAMMDYAKEKGWYFIDSKTVDSNVARDAASERAVPFLKRDVFLDNSPSTGEVIRELQETLKVAKEQGYAIAIGHVGPEKGRATSAALKQMIPKMQAEGVEFVTVSELMARLQVQ